jgi:hypothetical protein
MARTIPPTVLLMRESESLFPLFSNVSLSSPCESGICPRLFSLKSFYAAILDWMKNPTTTTTISISTLPHGLYQSTIDSAPSVAQMNSQRTE